MIHSLNAKEPKCLRWENIRKAQQATNNLLSVLQKCFLKPEKFRELYPLLEKAGFSLQV